MPLIAAAVCPHPPLLVPDLAPGPADELDTLRTACRVAARELAAAPADALIVVGGDSQTVRRVPPHAGSFAPWGVDLAVGEPGGSPLPLSLLVGAWLCPAATGFVSVAVDAPPAECAALGAELAAGTDRLALLVMGDGSACRGERAPGYLDPRAEPFDTVVGDALAKVDVDALLALDPVLAAELLVAGRAPWQVLAGAVGDGGLHGDLRYHDAPFGVGYFVAVWHG